MTKIIYFFITLILLSISSISPTQASYVSGGGTKVQASIPSKVDIRLYGYTAPYAIVQATSVRVFAQVSSDKTGYFMIDPLPVSQEAREICLTTIDSQQRSGFPVCIALPDSDKPTEIGPLLLAPTISLSKNKLIQQKDTQGQAAGVAIPNTDIEISFFDNKSRAPGIGNILIPQAEAKNIPKITTQTDNKGSYSINLPATQAFTYRIFARAFYQKSPTPKSQTLSYSVLSYSRYWIRNILPLFILLFFFILITAYLTWFEIKTKKGRLWWLEFNEMQLKPFGVRTSLRLRRLWYNFRGLLRSDRI